MKLVGNGRGPVRWVAIAGLAAGLLFATAVVAREVLPVRSILGLTESAECVPDPVYTRYPANAASEDGRWEVAGVYPVERDEVRATALDGRIYVGTGLTVREGDFRSLSEFFGFDPAQGTFEELPDVPERVDHAALVAHGDAVYVIGGYVDVEPTAAVWRFTPSTGRWDALPSLRVARGSPAAAVVGDTIYVVGGSRDEQGQTTGAMSSVERYEIGGAAWTLLDQEMPTPRHHHGAAAVNGKVVVVGGRNDDDLSLDAVEQFDPESGRWTRLSPLPQGAGGVAVIAVDGRVVATGGGDDRGTWITPATWSLDPAENRWRRLADLNAARHGHGAAAVGSDVYVFAGSPCPGYGRSDSVERLNASDTSG